MPLLHTVWAYHRLGKHAEDVLDQLPEVAGCRSARKYVSKPSAESWAVKRFAAPMTITFC